MSFRLAIAVAAALGCAALRAEAVENEKVLNRRGYELLRKGDVDGAIRVFQRNVEAYPDSANVYDSLGEAYAAAGDTPNAIENYRRALALDPRSKSARYALERLTGERRPIRPAVMVHAAMGLLGLLAGTAAMVLRKGSRPHALAGRVFVGGMLLMSSSAAAIAFFDEQGETINRMMGLLTFYLVGTGWLTARRKSGTGPIDRIASYSAWAIAAALWGYGSRVAGSSSGSEGGVPAAVFFVFAAVAALAANGDRRMVARGGVTGTARIVRHLWRMCAALFIAAGSFFLGQPQVFPDWLRNDAGLRAIPVLLVLAALAYWLIRVRFPHAYKAGSLDLHTPPPPLSASAGG
jgi:hypothetical protein